MGLTDAWLVTTEGQREWTATCEREIEARFNWNEKWGWIPAIVEEPINKLKELKGKQVARIQENTTKLGNVKNPRPLPKSVNHEYGWLAEKPEYALERFGPFPFSMKVSVLPTPAEVEAEIAQNELDRGTRAMEQKQAAEHLLSDKGMKEENNNTTSCDDIETTIVSGDDQQEIIENSPSTNGIDEHNSSKPGKSRKETIKACCC